MPLSKQLQQEREHLQNLYTRIAEVLPKANAQVLVPITYVTDLNYPGLKRPYFAVHTPDGIDYKVIPDGKVVKGFSEESILQELNDPFNGFQLVTEGKALLLMMSAIEWRLDEISDLERWLR